MFENENYGNQRRYDEPLFSEKIFAERKVFFVDLKANDRGKFLKITEDVRGRRDTIMVPVDILGDLIGALQNVSDFLDSEGEGESEGEGDPGEE